MTPRSSEPETFPDYTDYLHQDELWPTSDGPATEIDEMTPQYAIGAYHKLVRWGWTSAHNPSPGIYIVPLFELPAALLAKATGFSKKFFASETKDAEPEEVSVMNLVADIAIASYRGGQLSANQIVDIAEKLDEAYRIFPR